MDYKIFNDQSFNDKFLISADRLKIKSWFNIEWISIENSMLPIENSMLPIEKSMLLLKQGVTTTF
jgi:hypothetical protein